MGYYHKEADNQCYWIGQRGCIDIGVGIIDVLKIKAIQDTRQLQQKRNELKQVGIADALARQQDGLVNGDKRWQQTEHRNGRYMFGMYQERALQEEKAEYSNDEWPDIGRDNEQFGFIAGYEIHKGLSAQDITKENKEPTGGNQQGNLALNGRPGMAGYKQRNGKVDNGGTEPGK